MFLGGTGEGLSSHMTVCRWDRGGYRGGVEGVATPPLRIFFVICLILRKIMIE